MLLVWEFFSNSSYCFWKIRVVLKRSLKGPIGGKCRGSTAAVWHRLTAKEAEAGLVASAVAPRWWLKERWFVVVCQVVKRTVVCQSVASSALKVDRQRILRVLICCVDFLCL